MFKCTFFGRLLDFSDEMTLIKNNVSINEIALSLARQPRYNGCTPDHYSVAQHSVMCSQWVRNPHFQMDALLHDAEECFLGDIIHPVKEKMLGLSELSTVVKLALMNRFPHLTNTSQQCVGDIDKAMWATEIVNFFPDMVEELKVTDYADPLAIEIETNRTTEYWAAQFVNQFELITSVQYATETSATREQRLLMRKIVMDDLRECC